MPRIPKLRRRSDRDLCFVEHLGKRHYLGPPGPETEAKYHAWIAKHFATEGAEDITTVAALAYRYLDAIDGQYSQNIELRHVKYAVSFLKPWFDLPCDQFGPRKLTAARQAMVDSGRWQDSYTNKQIGRLQRMFRWGTEREYLQGTTYQALLSLTPLRCPPRQRRKITTLANVRATLPHLRPHMQTMVEVQLLTGCRPAQICELQPAEIDRTESPWKWHPLRHKKAHRGSDLVIWIGTRAQQHLTPYLHIEPYCFPPTRNFDSPHCTPGAYRMAIVRAAKAAGVEPWAPYDLRHIRADLVEEQYGVEGVQAVLDHDSLNTSKHYLDRRRSLARRIAAEQG